MLDKSPENCKSMHELRLMIDEIDRDLVVKIALRVRCVEQAARIKVRDDLPAYIPERIEAVIANVRAHAVELGSAPDLMETLWRDMIDWAVKHETNLMKRAK